MAFFAAIHGTVAASASTVSAALHLARNPSYHKECGGNQNQYDKSRLYHINRDPIWNKSVDAIHASPIV